MRNPLSYITDFFTRSADSNGTFQLSDVDAVKKLFGDRWESASGVAVDPDTARKFSAVWQAVYLISTQTASFPLAIYERQDNATAITRPSDGWGVSGLRQSDDASKVVTRVWSSGGGSQVLQTVPVALATSFPIQDASKFAASPASLAVHDSAIGDYTCTPYVLSGTQRFTYSAARIVSNAAVTTATANAAAYTMSLSVADTSIFPGTGWAKVRDKCFRYIGRSTSSGPGDLLNIPNGVDYQAITVNVVVGDAVTPLSCLEGVSGVIADIPAGQEVTVHWKIQANANPASVSTAVGFPLEARISDGRLGYQEALDRGEAELLRSFNPIVTLSWTTRDITMLPGRSVTVNASAGVPANNYLVQAVTITREYLPPTTTIFPLRHVEASSIRETFAQLMRQIQGTV